MSHMQQREHGWDSLRGFLMLLGIPYHASMAYNTRVMWDIHSPDGSSLLTFLSGILVTFRMPVFFVVAGYFAAMMLARKPAGKWLKNRYMRLGIPFITGFILLAPPQLLMMNVAAAVNGVMPMPQALAIARTEMTHPSVEWIMHLWFLPTLVVYCTAAAFFWTLAGTRFAAPVVEHVNRWLDRRCGLLFVLSIAVAVLWEVMLYAAYIQLTAMGGGLAAVLSRGLDPYLRYVPYFFLGLFLWRQQPFQQAFALPRGIFLPAITILTAIVASLTKERGSDMLDLVNVVTTATAAIMASRLLIGYAHRYWNHPSETVSRIVDASFTIYLLHHPIIYALATYFLLVTWPPIIEFSLITVTTFLLSYGAHRLIRRSRIALFLMNGVYPAPRPSRAGEANSPA